MWIIQIRLVKVVSIIINNIMPQQLFFLLDTRAVQEKYRSSWFLSSQPLHCMVCCKIYWIFHCNLQALHWIFATPITMVGLDLTWLWPTRVDFALSLPTLSLTNNIFLTILTWHGIKSLVLENSICLGELNIILSGIYVDKIVTGYIIGLDHLWLLWPHNQLSDFGWHLWWSGLCLVSN